LENKTSKSFMHNKTFSKHPPVFAALKNDLVVFLTMVEVNENETIANELSSLFEQTLTNFPCD